MTLIITNRQKIVATSVVTAVITNSRTSVSLNDNSVASTPQNTQNPIVYGPQSNALYAVDIAYQWELQQVSPFCRQPTYLVGLSIGIRENMLRIGNSILETSAGLSLIDRSFLPRL